MDMRLLRPCFVSLAVVLLACSSGESQKSDTGAGGLINGGEGANASSGSAGAPTTTSSSPTTTTTTTGSGGAGGAAECLDIGLGEPNESESQAFELKNGAITECNDQGGTLKGIIASGDTDWFRYEGDDGLGLCVVDPSRTLSPDDQGLRVCVYPECFAGGTKFTCPSPTTPDTSPSLRPGCCHNQGFTITNLNCPGFDEHVTVYIRVDHPNANASTCVSYELGYHF